MFHTTTVLCRLNQSLRKLHLTHKELEGPTKPVAIPLLHTKYNNSKLGIFSHLVGTGSVTLDLRDGSLLSFPTSISLLLILHTERKKRSLRVTDYTASMPQRLAGYNGCVSSSAFYTVT